MVAMTVGLIGAAAGWLPGGRGLSTVCR